MHDLRHRLRNAYAVSGAITLASARESPEHQAFAAALAQRFTVLSLALTRLLDDPESSSLRRLAEQLTEAHAARPGAVRLVGLPDATLGEQHGRLVALVLGELCANSVRHGALAHGEGAIDLGGSVADGRLRLEWREPLGDGLPAEEEAAGLRLLTRMARAHGGSFLCAEEGGTLVARLELAVDA